MKMGLIMLAAAAMLGTAAIATPASAQDYRHGGYHHRDHHDWHRDHRRHDRWHHRGDYHHRYGR